MTDTLREALEELIEATMQARCPAVYLKDNETPARLNARLDHALLTARATLTQSQDNSPSLREALEEYDAALERIAGGDGYYPELAMAKLVDLRKKYSAALKSGEQIPTEECSDPSIASQRQPSLPEPWTVSGLENYKPTPPDSQIERPQTPDPEFKRILNNAREAMQEQCAQEAIEWGKKNAIKSGPCLECAAYIAAAIRSIKVEK